MFWERVVITALAGALGAGLAQRGAVIYNDGLRALAAETLAGRLPPRQLAGTAFKLSAGLLVGFALPFSLVSGLLLVHALWLGSDLIGVWLFREDAPRQVSPGRGAARAAGALAAGALYGAALALALEGFNSLAAQLPLHLDGVRALFAGPVVFSFAVLPAIAIAYQHGLRNGILAFGAILLARLLAGWLGFTQPDNWALAVGLLIVFLAALGERPPAPSSAGLPFAGHMARLRRQFPAAAGLGVLYGLAAHQAAFVEGPQALLALAGGKTEAAIQGAIAISLARALVFTPIKTLSMLASGVFVTDGLGFAWTAGLAAPNAWSAALLGGLAMSLELLALGGIARLLQRFPGLGKAAGHLRTAMTRLLEAALLVGGMIAAESLAPGYGFLLVAGVYMLNEATGARLLRMAVGPLALLLVWLAANAALIIAPTGH